MIRSHLKTTLLLAAGLACGLAMPSFAEGLPNRTPQRAPAAAAAPANPWTGCGVGVYGSIVQGTVDIGSTPLQLGSEGTTFGGKGLCDYQIGRGVIGGFVDYGRMFGDLETIGVNSTLSIGGRAGYLIYRDVLPYAKAAWTRADTDAGNLDGYSLGGGVEIKLPDSPLSVDLSVERSFFSDAFGSGLDVEATTYRLGANWKFNFLGQ